MKRFVVFATLLPLAVATACGGSSSTGAPPGTGSGGDQTTVALDGTVATTVAPETTASVPMVAVDTTVTAAGATTPEEVRAAIDAKYAAETWYPRLTGIATDTGLGARVWMVDVDVTGIESDVAARSDTVDGIRSAVFDLVVADTVNVVARYSDGTIMYAGSTSSNGGQLAQIATVPAAPTTPDEVDTWLQAVYGPGGLAPLGPNETWLASITSLGLIDDGYGPTLSVNTTLTGADVWQLTLLQAALQSTGMLIPNATINGGNYYVSSMSGGSFGGTMPPGSSGFMYPART
jgi:hypothetical protein